MPQLSRYGCLLAVLLLAGCADRGSVQPPRMADPAIDWAAAKTVSVTLSDFDFSPSTLNLQSNQPVKLLLANTGSDRHDFSAPAFFAASAFRQGAATPVKGKISLAKAEKAEVDVVPGAPGQYPLDCTEFLHAMLGMTGQINVTDAPH